MGQQKSSMLLFLSRYLISQADKKKLEQDSCYEITEKENDYVSYINDDSGKPLSFSGSQTNDAPVKFLLELASRNGEPIDKIFCIVSKEVFIDEKLPSINGYQNIKTAFDRFSKVVEKINKNIEIVPIYYDFKLNSGFSADNIESGKMASHIYHQIENKITGKSIYIDYTGGLRDSSLFMIAIIRYLEFRDIVCKDIVYSNFHSNPKSIQNIRYIYDMLEMVNAVSEFVGTGNASKLSSLWEKKIKLLSGNLKINETVEGFIESIKDFSDAISICKVDEIENSLERIIQAIDELERCEDKDIFVSMFKTLIPIVREKMNIEKNNRSILDLVQWCWDNNMLQQAVTIYNERILEYYSIHYDSFKQKIDPLNINFIKSTIKDWDTRVKQGEVTDIILEIKKKFKKIGEVLENIQIQYENDEFPNENLCKETIEEFVESFFKREDSIERFLANRLQKGIDLKKFNYEVSIEFIKSTIKDWDTRVKQGEITDIILEIKKISEEIGKKLEKIKEDYEKNNLPDKYLNKKTMEEFMASFFKREKTVEEFFINRFRSLDISALNILKSTDPELWHAMKYYHAIRVIRNDINHVSGEKSDMSKTIREYLEKEGLGENSTSNGQMLKFERNREFISNTLKEAIKFSKGVCERDKNKVLN